MRFVLPGVLGVLSLCLLSAPALASRNGVIGNSGKQPQMTCMSQCHGGKASQVVPTVTLTGPTHLGVGETGEYSLLIRGGPAVTAGTNISVDNVEASLEPGRGLRKRNKELTHTEPLAFSGDEARFDFTLVAPPKPGTLRVFAMGNSSNGDNDPGGDHVVGATLDITIAAAVTGVRVSKSGCNFSAGTGAPLFPLLALLALRARRPRRS
jgi:MYXO-CTERM domain-containing protein